MKAQSAKEAFPSKRQSGKIHPSWKAQADSAMVVSIILGLLAGGLMVWEKSVRRHPLAPDIKPDVWKHIEEHFPIPPSKAIPLMVSGKMLEGIVATNPFSPLRGKETASSGVVADTQAPIPVEAQWIYKGRIALGKRQRAILENTTTGKTHFLEVGQAVAGFKLLDMSEGQVILSDEQTDKHVVLSLTSTTSQATTDQTKEDE